MWKHYGAVFEETIVLLIYQDHVKKPHVLRVVGMCLLSSNFKFEYMHRARHGPLKQATFGVKTT